MPLIYKLQVHFVVLDLCPFKMFHDDITSFGFEIFMILPQSVQRKFGIQMKDAYMYVTLSP